MARDPGSVWCPLREWTDQGSFTKDKFIVHSTGDRNSAAQIYAYFNRPEIVVESTFIVGLDPSDPTLQILDSAASADANVEANQSGISVEVVGTGDDDYTDWQVSELIRLGKWAREAHPLILPQIIPDKDGHGYGWHVMFGAPGPWTTVKGKVCPGATRIKHLTSTIFPAIFDKIVIPAHLEDEVTPEDVKAIATEVTRMIERNKSPLQRARIAAEDSIDKLDAITELLPKPSA